MESKELQRVKMLNEMKLTCIQSLEAQVAPLQATRAEQEQELEAQLATLQATRAEQEQESKELQRVTGMHNALNAYRCKTRNEP